MAIQPTASCLLDVSWWVFWVIRHCVCFIQASFVSHTSKHLPHTWVSFNFFFETEPFCSNFVCQWNLMRWYIYRYCKAKWANPECHDRCGH